MEVIRADTDGSGEIVQWRRCVSRLNQPAGLGDFLSVLLRRQRLIRLAALARTETRSFRVCARPVKRDVLAIGETRRTRRPAIDATGRDRIIEFAIAGSIARRDRLPAAFGV
jgi:hypothetical protein